MNKSYASVAFLVYIFKQILDTINIIRDNCHSVVKNMVNCYNWNLTLN